VSGLRVGNAHDVKIRSGVSVILPDSSATAAVDVRGGGPGTRETDALALTGTVDEVHGLVLSGGSAFGLAAADGVQRWLAARQRGYQVGTACIPIVPQAILFDLMNGGDKSWSTDPATPSPYTRLALEACDAAAEAFDIGSVGAGYGATTANLKGGLGSASLRLSSGYTVGALVAVNALGSATIGDGAHFWAAMFERDAEFGGRGLPVPLPAPVIEPMLKGASVQNTTIAIVATDAPLTKPQCKRLAVMAQSGLARALHPIHSPLDGDVVFAISTGACGGEMATTHDLTVLGSHAADTLSRAVARGVYSARAFGSEWPNLPAWQDKFG
jgi:D-aminopeptidase